jgi:parallel beta-helix repeat protein
MFFLDLDNSGGPADQSVAFGEPDDLPVIGDWDGDADDNIGLYRPGSTTGVFYLDIDNDGGAADIVTPEYGDLGDIPIAGDWDGDSDDNIGVYRPDTREFFLNASLPSVPKTIYVDDDFTDDPSEHRWDTIQEGVDDAADGDIVIVYAGVYVENVDVSKRISLIGEGAHDLDDGLGIGQLEVKEKGTSIDLDEGGNTRIIDDVGFMASDDGGDQYGLFVRRTVGSIPSLDIEFPDPTVVNKGITITVTSDGSPIEGAEVKFAGENLGLTDSDGKVRVTSEDTGTFTITATKEGYESASEDIQILTDDVVTVWAADARDHVFEVTADWVNIAGFNVTGATGYRAAGIYLNHTNRCTTYGNNASNNTYGICLEDSSNNTLTSNTASNNWCGIYLRYSSNNTIQDNTASNNNWYGICLIDSGNNTLTSNAASNNYYDGIELMDSNNNMLESNTVLDNSVGIELFSSCNNTLANNTASNNSYNGLLGSSNNILINNVFIDDGLLVEESCRNTVENNTVNGKPLVYLEDVSDCVIQNAGQVILVNCTNITVENLKISNTSVGVELVVTDDCKITNNIVSNNRDGIVLIDGSSNNTLTNNIASNNEVGISLWDSSNYNMLTRNTVSNNDYGICIHLCYSSNNLYHNNLINNTQNNAYDYGSNAWDSGSEGNYWSDYNGTDNNTDGIGDTPYDIPGGSIDHFPLMHPWNDTPQIGDLNRDGSLTPADAAIVLAFAAGGAHDSAADVSGDGKVTSLDALMILQAAADAIDL